MRELTATLESMGRSAPESRLLWENAPGSILASYTVGIYVDRLPTPKGLEMEFQNPIGRELIGESPGETLESAEEMAARDALRLDSRQRPMQFRSHTSPFAGIFTVQANMLRHCHGQNFPSHLDNPAPPLCFISLLIRYGDWRVYSLFLSDNLVLQSTIHPHSAH